MFQKIDYLRDYSNLPVFISIDDLMTIISNCDKDRFLYYLEKRLEIIQNYKNLEMDVDEVDAYGSIVFNDIDNLLSTFSEFNVRNIIYTISQSNYRKSANESINNDFLNYLMYLKKCNEK